ncbi:MAG TPA: hypothetical protein VK306_13145 [Acidimicrobiales bacterium]|nr:hypothetical protein [Acidimicrobiales bacterium]
MPWCETCSRFLNPNSLEADGSCPTCGRVVADAGKLAADRAKAADGEVDEKTPWHFKLLIAVVVLYLGWRLVQVIGWIVTVQPPLH